MQALTRAVDFSERGGTRVPSSEVEIRAYAGMERGVLRKALDDVLLGEHPQLGLEEMHRSGILGLFHGVPPLVGFGGGAQGHKDLWEHTKTVVAQSERRAVIRWAALYHDIGKVSTFRQEGGKVTFHGHEARSAKIFGSFCQDSGLFPDPAERGRIADVILNLGRVEAFEDEWSDSAVRRLDRELGEILDDCITLSRADITTGRDHKRQAILRSIDDLLARLRRTREEDAAPRLPKGLGDVIHERLGVPKDRELGDLMAALKRDLDQGRMPPDADVERWVERAREVRSLS